ncbi:hypothetical protein AVM02_00100 [Brucella anthropi]|uniref:hypothetical protein n=1 Tax=Brucella anthropi TaxID=529 RepID=UPI003986EC6C
MSQKNHIWPAYVDMMTVLLLVYILMNCMFSVIISNADLDKKGGAASGSDPQQISAAGNALDQNAAAGQIDTTKASSDQDATADRSTHVAAAPSGIANSTGQSDHGGIEKQSTDKTDRSTAAGSVSAQVASDQNADATKSIENSTLQSNAKNAGRTDKEKLAAGSKIQAAAAGAVVADAAASDRKAAASSAAGSVSVETHNSDNAAEAGDSIVQKHAAGDVAQANAAGNQTRDSASSGDKTNVTAAAGSQNLMFLQAYKDLYNNKPGDLQIKFSSQQESYLDSDKTQVVSWLNNYKGKSGTYAVGVFVHDAGGKSSSSQLVQQTSLYYQLMAIFKAQGIDLTKVDIRNAAPSDDIDNVVKARFVPCQGECAVQNR